MNRHLKKAALLALGSTFSLCAASATLAFGKSMPVKRASAPVVLTVWVPGPVGSQTVPWQNLVNDFNSEYRARGLSASIQFFSWTDYPEKLQVAMNGGVGPDILFNGAAATAGLVTSKTVIPLDHFIASDPQVRQILPGYESQTLYQKKSWFIPVEAGVLQLEYRKDIFQAAHLAPPTTWTALLDDAVKLTIPGKRLGMYLPTSGIPLEQAYSEFLYSNNGNFVDASGRHATVDSKQALQSLEWYTAFFNKGAASIKFVVPSGQDPLGTGQAAMELANGNLVTIKQLYPKVYDDIGFLPFPRGPMGKYGVSYAAANGFYISSASKHPADAWLFLKTALQHSGELAQAVGGNPVLKQDQNAPWIRKDPELSAMFHVIATSHLQGNANIPQWINVRNTFATDVQAALYGQSPASVLQKAESDLQQILNQQ